MHAYHYDGADAVIPLTQEELAGLAGTSRATVNRVLREAERAGTLKLSRGKVAVLDEASSGEAGLSTARRSCRGVA